MIEQRFSLFQKERLLTRKRSLMLWGCLLENAVAVGKIGEEIQKVSIQMLPTFSSLIKFSRILREKKKKGKKTYSPFARCPRAIFGCHSCFCVGGCFYFYIYRLAPGAVYDNFVFLFIFLYIL